MARLSVKIEWSKSEKRWHGIPTLDRRILWAAIIFSLLIHFLSYVGTGWMGTKHLSTQPSTVKIRSLTQSEKKLLDKMAKDTSKAKRIIETNQTETAPPKNPDSLGAQDHQTTKETKLSQKKMNNSKALDPSPPTPQIVQAPKPKSMPHTAPTELGATPKVFTGPGSMAIGLHKEKPRTNYEKLFPDKSEDVFAKPNGGYMEHVEADVADGDRIDMNTSSFKFISYFTGLRKQIELVWIYPSDAVQRGLQGAVQLEITIEKDGRVSKARVLQSSGYASLDDNMLKTIKLASPFAPLPKAWGKEHLIVSGSFHYVLSYAAH